MFGLAGVELINVVDVNLALKKQYDGKRKAPEPNDPAGPRN
jgi:hypothetical protein